MALLPPWLPADEVRPPAPAAARPGEPRPLPVSTRTRSVLAAAGKERISDVAFLIRPKAGWIALRVRSRSGAEGFAVYTPSQHPLRNLREDGARAALTELLVGRSPVELADIWRDALAGGLPPGLLWMADVALWDLVGRAAGKAVHRLLGGRRTKIACYASSPVAIGEPERYVAQAREIRDRGYHGYKVHPYFTIPPGVYPAVTGGDPLRDRELLIKLRAEMGPKFPMMWDNFRSYGYDDALEIGRLAAEHGYLWLESPMLEDDEYCMRQYVRLRRALKGVIPLCGPEHVHGGPWERLEWMRAGAIDINRIDPNYGGFSGPLAVAEACAEEGVPLELHFHLPHDYNLQVAGAASESIVRYLEVFEGPPGKSRADFLAGRSGRDAAPGRPVGSLDVADIDLEGYIPLPERPGMGPDVDWAQLEAAL